MRTKHFVNFEGNVILFKITYSFIINYKYLSRLFEYSSQVYGTEMATLTQIKCVIIALIIDNINIDILYYRKLTIHLHKATINNLDLLSSQIFLIEMIAFRSAARPCSVAYLSG